MACNSCVWLVRWWWWWWGDEGRFGTTATTVCVRATCVGCAFLIAAAAFIIIIIIIIIMIIIIIQVHNVCECSVRVFWNDGARWHSHNILYYTYNIHTRVVFNGLRRCRFSPSRFIDPLASSSSQQYIIIICDASAWRTWLARVPKIPEGFSKPVFVYSRFDFIVVVNNIRTVAAGSTCVFLSIF